MCDWYQHDENEYAFFRGENARKSPFPILNFTLLNQSGKTVILKVIYLKVNYLPSGLHGLPKARVLKPLVKYEMHIQGENNRLSLVNPIEVEVGAAFLFQIELSMKHMDESAKFEIEGRKILSFDFKFSGGVSIQIPDLFFNCISEYETLRIVTLS